MSLDQRKTDPLLGKKIHTYLMRHKVETPVLKTQRTPQEKVLAIQNKFEEIMQILGLDMNDDSLCGSPERVAKMFVYETLWGLDYQNFPRIMDVDNKMNCTSMVVERRIRVNSLCEHHFVPIIGTATIAYIPKGRIIGLSKLNRVVEFFCRRPQVQERLMEQIYHALSYILNTKDIAVTIVADHFCVKYRGIEDPNSDTVTTKLGGLYMTDMDVRSEYYQALKL